MINSVHMKCFRKHVDKEVNFDYGLNVLRGPNEEGKTTIIEAVTYGWWGAKALRDTLAETVTWGQKESALWVKTVSTFAGIAYTVTRSKAGAECNYVVNGEAKKVVGQSEVTAFMSGLLGVDAKLGAALILATQSDLRGTLEEGPTAASGLMAKLADFDLIDKLVVSAQGNLVLGAEKPVREKLVQAEVDAAGVVVPTETKADFYDNLRAGAQHSLDTERAKESALAAAVETATLAVQAAVRQNDAHAQAERDVQRINQQVTTLFAGLRTANAVVERRPAPGAAVAAIQALTSAQQHATLAAAYALVNGLPAYPASFWEGTKASFDIEMQALQATLTKAKHDSTNAQNAMTRCVARKMGDGKCPTCGATNVSKEHIDKHNAEVTAEAEQHAAALDAAQQVVAVTQADIVAMNAVVTGSRPFEAAVKALMNRDLPITIDESNYPPKITWTGEVPVAADVKRLQAELDAINKLHSDADKAEGQAETLKGQIEAAQKALEYALTASRLSPEVDLTPLEEERKNVVEAHRALLGSIGELMTEVQNYTSLRDESIREQQEAQIRKEAADLYVIELRRELDTLIFNNALVAKLRTLKPKITDDLWNKVLSAVSSFFSTLRGEASVVTKGSNGFRVNDRSIDSLSGSTLDVLAIAIRVAMTKTFIPQATFIVLDEPAHGCDTLRTGKVLGFLSSVGFDQVILASHDELSEAVADRVVALGA